MRRHILQYELLTYIRNRDAIVWLVAFPIAFVTFFTLALSTIFSDQTIELPTIRLAVVQEEKTDQLIDFLDKAEGQPASFVDGNLQAKDDLEEEAFALYTLVGSHDEEKSLLLGKKVDAIFLPKDKLGVEMTYQMGFMPSLVQGLATAYESSTKLSQSIEEGLREGDIPMETFNPDNLDQIGQNRDQVVNEGRIEGLNPMQIFAFSVMAYLAFFPVSSGLDVVESVQANQSKQAMRKSISPVSKKKHFLASFFARSSVHLVLISIIYLYTLFLGLKVGSNHAANISPIWLGALAAIVTGCVIGALFKSDGVKSAFGIGLPLLFGAVSGLMSEHVHRAVMSSIPWLHNYNPLGRVTNGLYFLTVDGGGSRYFDQIIGLVLYILIGLLITSFLVKEDQYESL